MLAEEAASNWRHRLRRDPTEQTAAEAGSNTGGDHASVEDRSSFHLEGCRVSASKGEAGLSFRSEVERCCKQFYGRHYGSLACGDRLMGWRRSLIFHPKAIRRSSPELSDGLKRESRWDRPGEHGRGQSHRMCTLHERCGRSGSWRKAKSRFAGDVSGIAFSRGFKQHTVISCAFEHICLLLYASPDASSAY